MNRDTCVVVAFLCFSVLRCTNVRAQPARVPESRIELSGGVLWTGTASYGSRDATLTSPGGEPFRLFSAASDLAAATGVEVRLGARVTRLVRAEVSGTYAVPRLKTTIGRDVEGAAPVTASEPIKQFTVEGNGIVLISRWRIGSRGWPFVGAGAGYVRQLDDANSLVQTGRTYQVGGGVKLFLAGSQGSGQRPKEIGLRVDGRVCIRTGGITLDGGAHTVPQFGTALFIGF
ncbi:MAG: hypothetical protein C5B57_12945 [Blastocatellia bacterium]|nr:MAG: hypothetical protein C5B57_12945 [Blastocatellia bacterium]